MTAIPPSAATPLTIAAPIPFAPPVTRTTLCLSCKSMPIFLRSVKSRCIFAEDFFHRRWRMPGHVLFDKLDYLAVACCNKADGPIGTKHEAVGSKRIEHYIKIRPEIFFLP